MVQVVTLFFIVMILILLTAIHSRMDRWEKRGGMKIPQRFLAHARYRFEEQTSDYLIISDEGPWDQCPTITNDAAWVVRHLIEHDQMLKEGQRLYYYDSEGIIDQIVFEKGEFLFFIAGGPKSGA